MKNDNPAQFLQNSFRIVLGVANSAVELLSSPQKWEENFTRPLQPLDKIIEELVVKGEKTESEINSFVKQLFPVVNPSPTYPKYVERMNEQCFLQPFDLKHANVYGFILEASWDKLQEQCDKYLNNPANGQVQYRPAMPYALLAFGDINSLGSGEKPALDRGCIDEQEVIIWILTMVGQQYGPIFKVDRLAWFVPFISVSNSPALVSGREIYGMPKELGAFKIPDIDKIEQSDRQLELFTFHTHVWKTLTEQTKATWEQLIAVSRKEEVSKSQLPKRSTSYKEAVEDIVRLLFGNNGIIQLPGLGSSFNLLEYVGNLGYLINSEIPVVMFKQFRDVEDGKRACYQAIVEMPMKVYQYHQGQLLSFGKLGDQFEVTIGNFASHPIVEELGLKGVRDPEKQQFRLPVKLAYWFNFNFTVENGKTIWKAP